MAWHYNTPDAHRTAAAGQETDAFVAKLDGGNGTRLWGWQGGSEGNDYANAVAVDRTGDVYACGSAPLGMFADAESATPPQGEEAGAAAAEREGGGGGGQAEGLWSYTDGGAMSARNGQRSGAVTDMFVAKVGFLLCCCVSCFFCWEDRGRRGGDVVDGSPSYLHLPGACLECLCTPYRLNGQHIATCVFYRQGLFCQLNALRPLPEKFSQGWVWSGGG